MAKVWGAIRGVLLGSGMTLLGIFYEPAKEVLTSVLAPFGISPVYMVYIAFGLIVVSVAPSTIKGVRGMMSGSLLVEVSPDLLIKHRKQLRDDAFVKWRDAKVVRTETGEWSGISLFAAAPVYLKISVDIDWRTWSRAVEHLRSKKYRDEMRWFYEAGSVIQEHNRKMWDVVKKIDKEVNLALLRFPQLVEQGQGRDYYIRAAILRAIESHGEIKSGGPDIYGGNEVIGYIENKDTRNQFVGAIRALAAEFASDFSDITARYSHAGSRYDTFKGFMGRVIERIDELDRLEGKCEIERGKLGGGWDY